MNRVKKRFVSEFEISRSKFISLLCPLESKEQVKEILKDIQREYPKATHYCYAYIFDENMKSNDDGEPAKTAGRPILEVMIKHDINRALLVVVRYFGGIKLGAGGLTRAYVQGATSVLDVSELYHEEIRKHYLLTVDYNKLEFLNLYIKENKFELIDINYEENVLVNISCKDLDCDDLMNYLQGKVKIEFLSDTQVLVKNI